MKMLSKREYFKEADQTSAVATKRIFKLELLDWYGYPPERKMFELYKKHGKIKVGELNEELKAWHKELADLRKRKVPFVRVHVVTLPLNDYLKFELGVYLLNEKAGEKIYLMDRELFNSIKRPKGVEPNDLLVVDETVFLTKYPVLKYGKYDDIVGAIRIDETSMVKKYKKYEDAILSKSVSLRQFIKIIELAA
ncbi:MAG: hypothetical protein KGH54_02530 [Candidatus Micrarchaeota archaeon]|nr:hypothetical protein [Candidatus Micrarchaeota archaeon]